MELHPGKRRSVSGKSRARHLGKRRSASAGLRGGAPRRPHANGRASRVHGTLGRRALTRPAAALGQRQRSCTPVPGPCSASLARERGRSRRSATPPRSRPPLARRSAPRLMVESPLDRVRLGRTAGEAVRWTIASAMKPSSACERGATPTGREELLRPAAAGRQATTESIMDAQSAAVDGRSRRIGPRPPAEAERRLPMALARARRMRDPEGGASL